MLHIFAGIDAERDTAAKTTPAGIKQRESRLHSVIPKVMPQKKKDLLVEVWSN